MNVVFNLFLRSYLEKKGIISRRIFIRWIDFSVFMIYGKYINCVICYYFKMYIFEICKNFFVINY